MCVATASHSSLDVSWQQYSGALDQVVTSEHLDQVWGVTHGDTKVWFRGGVTSPTPAGKIHVALEVKVTHFLTLQCVHLSLNVLM